jgi:ATP-dependent DNA helicase DinG
VTLTETASQTPVRDALADAVATLGGATREGQVMMADAVAQALADEEHLLVEAGTGTGKSLAYLVPSLLHDNRVVVATATLALQHQLVERDLPRLVKAIGSRPGVDASYAVLKGRSNYACLHRVREGAPDDQGTLVDVPLGPMAEKVLELRSWAEKEAENGGSGERDSAPRHTDREWRQVSVNHRDCLGAAKCPFGEECFVEVARDKAQKSHLIVTNHSLLAIDAIEGVPMIPEYDAVVIDEAHELVARVTQAATDELTAAEVERAARRAQKHVEGSEADDLADAADALRAAITETSPGRFVTIPEVVGDALVLVRDAARSALSALPKPKDSDGADPGFQQAKGGLQEVFTTAERMAAASDADVIWLSEGGERIPPRLCVAPLQVWAQMREKLLREKTVVFASATLKLGGDFGPVAGSLGLKAEERTEMGAGAQRTDEVLPWVGLDVGSPFDYGRQGILYVARHLPPPGRDGMGAKTLDEIVDLVDAADGRTLGLFSSRRGAPGGAPGGGGGGEPRPPRRGGGGRPPPRPPPPPPPPRGRPPPPRPRPRAPPGGGPPHPPPPDHLGPGRRAAARARRAVRRRPAHGALRHPVAVAGHRRARRHLPARDHRPDPVPAARRPADVRPAAGRRQGRRQRVHAGRRHPCRAAHGAGRRPADPHHHRPWRRGCAGRSPRDRPLRRLPQGEPAADVGHHRPGHRAAGAEATLRVSLRLATSG